MVDSGRTTGRFEAYLCPFNPGIVPYFQVCRTELDAKVSGVMQVILAAPPETTTLEFHAGAEIHLSFSTNLYLTRSI